MTHRTRKLVSSLMSAVLAGSIFYSVPAQADADSAKRIVKAMSDYMGSQNNLSGEFDAALDVITPQLERVTFDASGSVLLSRPNKVRLTRKGGYAEMELLSDGNTATLIDRANGAYSQAKSPATIDGLIDLLRNEYLIDMPGADLLLANSYAELMEGVVEAKHIGIGVIDGKDCDHLAFRNSDTDWQLWVRTGDQPLPCKYQISTKTVVGYPTYTVQFRNWSSGQAAAASAFKFTPAQGARKVEFDQMSAIGEVPPPAPAATGGR